MSPNKTNFWLILFFCTFSHGLHADIVDVGVVLDMESWVGKSINSSITMAISDFYARNDSYRSKIALHPRDSKGDPLEAMSNIVDLLNTVKVSAIIGPETYIGSKLVTDETKVPIFTFAGKSSMQHPYLFQIIEDEFAMTQGIAALVQLFKWRDLIFVYEDTDHEHNILEHLFESFQDKNIRITYRSAISASATNDQVIEELRKLMSIQTTIVIVHVSPSLASSIFLNAKMLGMMSKEYAWILTPKTIEIMHSTEFQVIESLQGAIGFRPYIPMSSKMHDLSKRWRNGSSRELPTLAIWAYDTVWALAESIEKVGAGSMILSEIVNIEFKGASGEFRLSGNKLVSNGFEIINAVDHGERKVGHWTVSNGIRRAHLPLHDAAPHSSSNIEDVIWPGGSTVTPKGWISRMNVGKTLRIGVRTGPSFNYFADAYYDAQKNRTTATGFSVDVFNTCLHALPYEVSYELVPFASGSYDDLINKVYNQQLDGVLGDSTILASRSQYVDFTATYTDVGIGTLIRIKERDSWPWGFLKRFDADLWLTYAVFGILAILSVWAIPAVNQFEHERRLAQQIKTIAVLVLLSIFFAQRRRLLKYLSVSVMIVWFGLVAFLFKQSYRATQASLTSVEKVELALKQGVVGFHGGSLFGDLKLSYNMKNSYHSYEDYDDALSRGGKHGGADAIVDEVPYIKMFLRRYPHDYAMVLSKPITSGFGFIFAKGSPLVIEMSREIAKIREDGTLMKLEMEWFGKDFSLAFPTMVEPPNLVRFWGLFIVIGVSLALALMVLALYLVRARMDLETIITFLVGQSLVATTVNLWVKISNRAGRADFYLQDRLIRLYNFFNE
ncbi:glutamate receptor 2.5 [Helianthus annuus]|uniref:glutamate receptor 2.5 n=1 Tax=Helianthus annuus TaxID=4232 RepID=UPI001652CA6A|nr:glutamate receptor 2.5 [Helianthus annuus]